MGDGDKSGRVEEAGATGPADHHGEDEQRVRRRERHEQQPGRAHETAGNHHLPRPARLDRPSCGDPDQPSGETADRERSGDGRQ